VIVLFLGLAIAPSINANVNKDEKRIEPLDNGEFEVYSIIDGYCEVPQYEGIIIKRQVRIYGGELEIKAHTWNPNEPIYYATTSQYLNAPVFIGVFYPVALRAYSVYGIAFGNIEWS
jgi:hypothetical protein